MQAAGTVVKVVEKGEHSDVRVEGFRIAKVASLPVRYDCFNEDLDAALGCFVGLVVLDPSSPRSFLANAFDTSHVIGDVRVVASRTGHRQN
jgi:hypothetical protein